MFFHFHLIYICILSFSLSQLHSNSFLRAVKGIHGIFFYFNLSLLFYIHLFMADLNFVAYCFLPPSTLLFNRPKTILSDGWIFSLATYFVATFYFKLLIQIYSFFSTPIQCAVHTVIPLVSFSYCSTLISISFFSVRSIIFN